MSLPLISQDCAVQGCIRTPTTTEQHIINNGDAKIIVVPLCDRHRRK